MKLTNYAIKNYQFTLIMVLMVAVLGAFSLFNMPRSEDPSMSAPVFPVTVIYPGMSPVDMEEQVAEPLEEAIYGMDDIKKVETIIENGLAILTVEFDYNVDVDNKFQALTRQVNSMRNELPQNIYSVEVKRIDPSRVNILQIELVSENASRDQLRTEAEDLQEALQAVDGLKNVEVQGLPEPIIRVDLNLAKLANLKLPVQAVGDALRSELNKIPGGSVVEGGKTFNIKSDGNIESLANIQNIIIAGSDNGSLFLKNVAEVYYDYAPEKHLVRLNGYRAVSVVAAMKKGQNITEVQEGYLPVIEQFESHLSANIDLVLHFDQAKNVNERLSGLGGDFLIAILLVLLTLLPLGNRASLVVMLAIPLSLAIGIITLNIFNYSLNQLSIVGFVVALGLLVDDSIVVVENIERWMREGYSRLEAAKKATGQISKAVLGCTATLIIAFMPLMFLPDEAGEFIRSLPLAIIATVFGSMIIALTVVPFFSSKLLKPSENEHGNKFLQALQKGIHTTYGPLLDRGLKHPVTTLLIALVIFGGSLFLIPVVGTSLFPSSEKPQFLIDVYTPLQSNIYYTDSVVTELEKKIAEIPEVKYYTSNVGKGNPQIYYNVMQKHASPDFAEIFVQLNDEVDAEEKQAIIADLREKWTPYPGARVEVKDFKQGVPVAAPVEVKIMGDDLETLRQLANRVEDSLEATPGTIYVNNPVENLRTDIRLDINKPKAQALGIPTAAISKTARLAVAGLTVGTFTGGENDTDYDIVMTVPRPPHPNLSVFDQIYVNTVRGDAVPLKRVVDMELESSSKIIHRLDKVRTVYVSANVKKGFLTDRVIEDVVGQMEQIDFPDGYHYEMGGEVENRKEAFGGFGSVVLVAFFLFFAVLVLQFGTFKSTFIVLSVIPLGIVGAVIALLVTGETLSFVATIGIIALAGIEVKNTILLVDFTNELREKGMPLMEAVEKGSEARFLPIILTTMTAIGGLTPIALSSNPLISPLAIVMIGGLISSTLLSRVVTPVVYKLMPPKIEVKSEEESKELNA